jgi:hypothetical protein
MDTSSEYTFPIFISSTDYNLKDLRAELARFLKELGYRPFLSSAEGFPDSSPSLEPWESCIPVLEKCFVVILVIDGRYGTSLNWPHYKEYFLEKKISPTHGEYIVSHRNKKRMLVFIRKDLMPHYQSYRVVMEKCKKNKEEAEKLLTPTLPDYVSFETLDFINEVKTTKPIPWINEFDDITTIKREIQKKMLNELAELFLVKNRHFETVIDSFNKVMDSLSTEKQKEILQKVHATKEIIDAVDKLGTYEKQIKEANDNLKKAQLSGTDDKEKYEKEIAALKNQITNLESETLNSSTSQFFITNGQLKFGNPNFNENLLHTNNASIYRIGEGFFNTIGLSGSTTNLDIRRCDNCGQPGKYIVNYGSVAITDNINTCPTCNRKLCSTCWPIAIGGFPTTGITLNTKQCPTCTQNVKQN